MSDRRHRKGSWRLSSQRRPSVSDTAIGSSDIVANHYAKQLNPYKTATASQHQSKQLRGSGGHHTESLTRGITEDEIVGDGGELDLADDDDDDDLGLDGILSSLVGLDEDKDGKNKAPAAAKVAAAADADESAAQPKGISYAPVSTRRGSDDDAGADKTPTPDILTGLIVDEKKDSSSITGGNGSRHHRLDISQVDFGNDAHRRMTPPIQNTTDDDDISPVSDDGDDTWRGDGDTLWTDGDATRENRRILSAGGSQCRPAFASGGFDDANRMGGSVGITGPAFKTSGKTGGSLVDSLIDDIVMGDDDNDSKPRSGPSPPTGTTPPRGGRFASGRNDESKSSLKPDPAPITPDEPQSTKNKEKFADRKKSANAPPKVPTTTSAASRSNKPFSTIHNREEETLSAVTDPTESPVIYTYKKSGDDDSVSQITSSLAGSSLAGSSLQNIPNNLAQSQSSRKSGLSWMDNGGDNTRTDLGGTGISRGTMHKASGMAIPGPYGRDRGRSSRKKFAGGRTNSRGSSNSSSTTGSPLDDFDGDEIAYARNAEHNNGRRKQSRKSGRPHVVQESEPFLGDGQDDMIMDDLSTVESSRADQSAQYIHTNAVSNVSRLGMGGVSCAPNHSVAGETTRSESTASSTLGLFRSLALFAYKTRHHARRYFFPKSPKVMCRKKFDRADSIDEMEEMLLEEGASTLSHRKRGSGSSVSSRRSGIDIDVDEEIDYFSRAMSSPSDMRGSGLGGKSGKLRKKYFWQGRTFRTSAFFLFTMTLIKIYRTPDEASRREFQLRPDILDAHNGDIDTHGGANGRRPPHRDEGADEAARIGRLGEPVQEDNVDVPDVEVVWPEKPPQQWTKVPLPQPFNVFANVDDNLFQRGIDVPFFWHIPRSGGGTMNDVLGSCLHLTLAADAGGGNQEESLRKLQFAHQVSYVNVDTSTHEGIARAKNLNLVSSGLSDVIISPLLHEASTLFTPTRKGRMFTIFRHPIERAASLFYFIQETQWQQPGTRNEQFAEITIDDFYKSGFAENNWMTRFLTNQLTKGELTDDDLGMAKEVLRRKCLVGLLEEKGETFDRIQKYFGWKPKNEEEQDCFEKKLQFSWPMKHKHPTIEEGSRTWQFIHSANKYDFLLYQFAQELFIKQGELLFRS